MMKSRTPCTVTYLCAAVSLLGACVASTRDDEPDDIADHEAEAITGTKVFDFEGSGYTWSPRDKYTPYYNAGYQQSVYLGNLAQDGVVLSQFQRDVEGVPEAARISALPDAPRIVPFEGSNRLELKLQNWQTNKPNNRRHNEMNLPVEFGNGEEVWIAYDLRLWARNTDASAGGKPTGNGSVFGQIFQNNTCSPPLSMWLQQSPTGTFTLSMSGRNGEAHNFSQANIPATDPNKYQVSTSFAIAQTPPLAVTSWHRIMIKLRFDPSLTGGSTGVAELWTRTDGVWAQHNHDTISYKTLRDDKLVTVTAPNKPAPGVTPGYLLGYAAEHICNPKYDDALTSDKARAKIGFYEMQEHGCPAGTRLDFGSGRCNPGNLRPAAVKTKFLQGGYFDNIKVGKTRADVQ